MDSVLLFLDVSNSRMLGPPMFSSNPTFELCPRDILLNIFHLVLPPIEQLKARHTVLTALRLVCYHWNDVVIFTPSFWSSIHIHIPSQMIPLSVLQAWLARSADASLNISLKDTPPINWTPTEIDIRTELLSTIQSHISHCSSLQLEVSVGFLPGFRSLPISEGRRLEHFNINMKGNTEDDVHQDMLQQLCSLPALHHISWSSNYRFFMKSLLHFSSPSWFSRLTHIEATCPISSNEMVELMKQCTSAIRITIDYVRCDTSLSSIVPPLSPTTLPTLRILDISLHSDVYQILIQNFSFPNLSILKITGPDMSDLSSTLNQLTPSLKLLKTKFWIQRNIPNELCTFFQHDHILKLPILEVQSREYETWGEYEGWVDTNSTPSNSDRPFWEAIEEFNKTCDGSRVVKYDPSSDLGKGCYVGWVDLAVYGSCMMEFSQDREVFMLQPHLLEL